MKNGKILSETYFRDFLQTVYWIDTNDTTLESYGKCATFWYTNIFLIPYGLKKNSNTVKFDFEHDFFKSLSKWGKQYNVGKISKMRNLVMLNIF